MNPVRPRFDSAQVHHIGTIRTGIGRHLPRINLGGCLCIFKKNPDLIVEHVIFSIRARDIPLKAARARSCAKWECSRVQRGEHKNGIEQSSPWRIRLARVCILYGLFFVRADACSGRFPPKRPCGYSGEKREKNPPILHYKGQKTAESTLSII